MKIVISSGHGLHIRGAAGPAPWGLDEVNEARKVVESVAGTLREMGVDVTTYHDNVSTSQNENLNRIVDFHNSKTRDLDVSVHFNATAGAHGCEVLYVTQQGLADQVVDAICAASGLTNRGPKLRSDLFFLDNTEEPSILIETCFVDTKSDCDTYRAKYNAICTAIADSISGKEAIGIPPPVAGERPPIEPPLTDARRTIAKGDNGADVAELQRALGVLIADGDFGGITETWVRAFQGSCGLSKDGVVGPQTWAQVDLLTERLKDGEPPLPKALADQIYTMAQQSEIAEFNWPGRGVMPPGYIAGMAQCFAYTLSLAGGPVGVMSRAAGSPDTDCLAWYAPEFKALGMTNAVAGLDTLRHLFVMQIGLGPRESSGRYFEGRDMSASNVESDTAEAGTFQTSWNIRSASSTIGPLLPEFWGNPHGFLEVFKEEELAPSSQNLDSYGSGDGLKYQFLSRFCPLFHVMVTAVGMRTLRQHWGPINRREVMLKREADNLLKEVQALVENTPQA